MHSTHAPECHGRDPESPGRFTGSRRWPSMCLAYSPYQPTVSAVLPVAASPFITPLLLTHAALAAVDVSAPLLSERLHPPVSLIEAIAATVNACLLVLCLRNCSITRLPHPQRSGEAALRSCANSSTGYRRYSSLRLMAFGIAARIRTGCGGRIVHWLLRLRLFL